MSENSELIRVIKNCLAREQEKKIRVAEAEIAKLKLEILELGEELPLGE
jgi:hypothetical protein